MPHYFRTTAGGAAQLWASSGHGRFGAEFFPKLPDLIPSVTTEDAEELIEQVKNAAYGPADAQKPGVGWHVYLDTATALYGSLPWYKKWVFRYIKGY